MGLFPASWTSSIKVGGPTEGQLLQPRPDYKAESVVIESVLQSGVPVFDKNTEDGTVFRIYCVGSLEVRTVQELNGNETIGAVFSICEKARDASGNDKVSGKTRIVKVTQYVERLAQGCGYFVVLETEQGTKILTERLPDMRAVFEESPAGLCERIASARVVRSADCSAAFTDVEGMKSYQALETRFGATFGKRVASPSKCKRYAHGAFNRAAGEVAVF